MECEYRITYSNGDTEAVKVKCRKINTGFEDALRRAREPLGNGTEREIARIEFWQRH